MVRDPARVALLSGDYRLRTAGYYVTDTPSLTEALASGKPALVNAVIHSPSNP